MTGDTSDLRCPWAIGDPLMERYHDTEWGHPERDDRRLFEWLTLEGAQAGLSWRTILHKRDGYRKAFCGFDPQRVSGFDHGEIDRLVAEPAIVRHRGKIESTVNNARRIVGLWDRGMQLADLVWSVVDGEPVRNRYTRMSDVPARTAASCELSRLLKREGFRFVGETTCYSLMQAAGLVNDHLVHCPAYDSCASASPSSSS